MLLLIGLRSMLPVASLKSLRLVLLMIRYFLCLSKMVVQEATILDFIASPSCGV